jgi:hypothetical protein
MINNNKNIKVFGNKDFILFFKINLFLPKKNK